MHYPLHIKTLFRINANRLGLYKEFPMTSIYEKFRRISEACRCAVKQYQI